MCRKQYNSYHRYSHGNRNSYGTKIWTSDLDYLSVNNKLTEYRKYILNISKENNFKYIDFFSAIKEHKSKCKASELFVDGIHPTPLGHKIMFNKVYEIFK
ncbi:SGNH/GDSL hydrolase family protein [Clostridium botulinum]|nr:SGNH/GDSL hydrolase family protein [Clostridium botulinum]